MKTDRAIAAGESETVWSYPIPQHDDWTCFLEVVAREEVQEKQKRGRGEGFL